MNRAISRHGLGVAGSNVLLALMYGAFAYIHLLNYAKTGRLSVLLIVLVETLILVFALVRSDPSGTWHSWKTWVTTVGGTFLPLLLRPVDGASDILAGNLVQLVGFILQVAAVLALNRSFGLLPAHRGVKTGGLYRWVRHPLYSAYALANIGYIVNHPSAWNITVFAFAIAFQVLRIRNEEEFLSRYDDYGAYAERTRWRLVPLVW
jgi:protein-S-isoprenylcysteine O-methyltransferase Ste14